MIIFTFFFNDYFNDCFLLFFGFWGRNFIFSKILMHFSKNDGVQRAQAMRGSQELW